MSEIARRDASVCGWSPFKNGVEVPPAEIVSIYKAMNEPTVILRFLLIMRLLCSVSCCGVVVIIPVLQVGDPWFKSLWQQTFTEMTTPISFHDPTNTTETLLDL